MPKRRDRSGSRRAWVEGAILALVALFNLIGNVTIHSPPRFDGAGYAVLARSLLNGQGYREIHLPGHPPHAHFPPGYPAVLAALWSFTGVSSESAHVFSMICTLVVIIGVWSWLRRIEPSRTAWWLALALACNWRIGREGGAILSEPLFLLETALILLAVQRGRSGIVIGLLLGAAILTRHVGIGLALAVGVDLIWRGHRKRAILAGLFAFVVVAPWLRWLAITRRPSQFDLVPQSGILALIADQALFYIRRIPDQIIGPIVEVGTVFHPGLAAPVTAFALGATALTLIGWLRMLRVPRRRLAGLIPLLTLPILLTWPFTEAGRFLVPLVPMILMGTAEGLNFAMNAIRKLIYPNIEIPPGTARRVANRAALFLFVISLPYSVYALVSGRNPAQESAHSDFDAACRWIAENAARGGVVLTRHPAEVFWQTGLQAVTPPDNDDSEAITQIIERYRITILLVDDDRYIGAPANPLRRYVETRPEGDPTLRLRKRWDRAAVYVISRT